MSDWNLSVTIRDVAKKAKVSPSTVSKVINNSPLISQKTIDHVNAVIEELNYVPNTRARNFAQKKNNKIIFLTLFENNMAFEHPQIFDILSGAEKITRNQNYSIEYVSADSFENAFSFVKKLIREQSADGIIVHGYVVTPEIVSILVKDNFPHILIGQPWFETSACWIDVNNIFAGELATRYLHQSGARHLAFIGGKKSNRISQMRLQGISNYVNTTSLQLCAYHLTDSEPTSDMGYQLTKEALETSSLPDAIVCENGLFAVGAVKAMAEKNLCVPQDIQFACFDKYPCAYMLDPVPVIVDIDVFELGSEAAKYLIKKVKNPNLHIQSYISIPTIIG